MRREIDTVVVENGGAFDVGVHVDHLGLGGSVDVLLQEEGYVRRLSILRIRVTHDGAVLRTRSVMNNNNNNNNHNNKMMAQSYEQDRR